MFKNLGKQTVDWKILNIPCGDVAAVEDLKTTSESTWLLVSSSLRLIMPEKKI